MPRTLSTRGSRGGVGLRWPAVYGARLGPQGLGRGKNSGPRMRGPMLVVFLLLLPPSPLPTTRSTLRYPTQDQGHDPSSRLQESPADGESCWSTYDVYFVLDS